MKRKTKDHYRDIVRTLTDSLAHSEEALASLRELDHVVGDLRRECSGLRTERDALHTQLASRPTLVSHDPRVEPLTAEIQRLNGRLRRAEENITAKQALSVIRYAVAMCEIVQLMAELHCGTTLHLLELADDELMHWVGEDLEIIVRFQNEHVQIGVDYDDYDTCRAIATRINELFANCGLVTSQLSELTPQIRQGVSETMSS